VLLERPLASDHALGVALRRQLSSVTAAHQAVFVVLDTPAASATLL